MIMSDGSAVALITTPGSNTGLNTVTPTTPRGSGTGLAVGLTLFFLLVVIVAGVFVYKYCKKVRDTLHLRHRRSQKTDDYVETPQTEPHQYMTRESSAGQTPIYENLTRTAHSSTSANQKRSLGEPEEDLYLQCDLPDDAIYSNDPACNLAILPDSQDEDVYIVPDS